MHILQVFLLAALVGISSLLGSGCAKANPGFMGDWNGPQPETELWTLPSAPSIGLAIAQDEARRSTVSCGDANTCSPSVGMLAAASENGVSTCTFSLVAPDLIATNSHCVPRDLKQAQGASCEGRIWAFFPAFGAWSAVQGECSRVMFASPIKEVFGGRGDFAFLRLKAPIARPSLELSHEGMGEGEPLSIQKVDPDHESLSPSGVLRSVQCSPVFATVLGSASETSRSPELALGSCQVMPGNSGSPILDPQGRMRGVLHGMLDRELTEFKMRFAQFRELLDGEVAPMAFATNWACLRTPLDPAMGSLPPECADAPAAEADPGKEAGNRALAKKLMDLVTRELHELKNVKLDPAFGWSFSLVLKSKLESLSFSEKSEFFAFPAPFCLTSVDRFLKEHGKGKMSRKLPAFEVHVGVNRALQLDIRVPDASISKLTAELEFDPEALARDRKALMRMTAGTSIPGEAPELWSGTLEECR